MCTSHSISLSVHVRRQQDRYDPTRTSTIRRKFEAEVNKRFRLMTGLVNKAIIEQDVFGLRNPTVNVTVPNPGAFSFPRSADKISAFMEWFQRQAYEGILEVGEFEQLGSAIDNHWSNMYVEDSYKRGVQRAITEMRKAGYPVESIAQQGGLQAIMNTPIHVDRLGVLYTRTFTDLKGVTEAMDTQISRILAQGIADGDNPRLLARKINATITGNNMGELALTDTLGRFIPAKRRALMIARTETARAHHLGSIQEYRNWEVVGLVVQAEFMTAGDDRVCTQCEGLQGNVYTLDEIEKLIPVHPNCRCVALPVPMGTEPPKKDGDSVSDNLREEFVAPYEMYKEEHDAFFSQYTAEQLLDFNSDIRASLIEYLDENNPDALETLREWQGNTAFEKPMALKWHAYVTENRVGGDFLFPGSWSSSDYARFAQNMKGGQSDVLSTNDYLSLRAFNQSYMERINFTQERLYRGIGDKAGAGILANIEREGLRRTNFSFTEAPVSGFSSSLTQANIFGNNSGGVTFTKTVTRTDVVVHRDLMSKLTNMHQKEQEFIILGGKRTINVNDIIR